eukprot:COSAG02_NODE_2108_length_9809_cov_4.022966_4_plen_94_part_00
MARAWVRAASIGRMVPFRALWEATTSVAADIACLGCSSAAEQCARFARASDASASWLGLPALADAPRLARSVGLRHSPLHLPIQTGRLECSRH